MLSVGSQIWIPCELSNGPFSDEMRVVVRSEGGDWIGFVPARWIRTISAGRGKVLCTVAEISGEHFVARIPGHASIGDGFMGWVSRANRVEDAHA